MPTNTRTFSPPKLHLMYIYVGIFTFHKCRFSLSLHAHSEHTAAHKLTQLFLKLFFQFLALRLLRLLWICFHLREFIHVLVLSLYETMCTFRAPLVKITKTDKSWWNEIENVHPIRFHFSPPSSLSLSSSRVCLFSIGNSHSFSFTFRNAQSNIVVKMRYGSFRKWMNKKNYLWAFFTIQLDVKTAN